MTIQRPINQIEPSIGEAELKAVQDYLGSGGWLTEYKRTREFERLIGDFIGCRFVSVVTSGTAALTLAVMALEMGQGMEVIVPDFTMIASCTSVMLAGVKPALCDVDRSNLCLALRATDQSIGKRTRAIMLVSFNGRCHDMDEVVEFAAKRNLLLIEDAAQAFGSKTNGKYMGSFGSVGCFSFSFPKIVTTGQGGAVVTNEREIHERIQKLKDFGRPVSGVDYHDSVGYNFKFTDLQAVIGIEQMKKLNHRIARKKEMFRIYREELGNISRLRILDFPEEAVPWFIDVLAERDRDGLSAFLNKRGIGTRPFYPAIHTQPLFKSIKGRFRNSLWASRSGLFLPSSTNLTDGDIQCVTDQVKKYFSES